MRDDFKSTGYRIQVQNRIVSITVSTAINTHMACNAFKGFVLWKQCSREIFKSIEWVLFWLLANSIEFPASTFHKHIIRSSSHLEYLQSLDSTFSSSSYNHHGYYRLLLAFRLRQDPASIRHRRMLQWKNSPVHYRIRWKNDRNRFKFNCEVSWLKIEFTLLWVHSMSNYARSFELMNWLPLHFRWTCNYNVFELVPWLGRQILGISDSRAATVKPYIQFHQLLPNFSH